MSTTTSTYDEIVNEEQLHWIVEITSHEGFSLDFEIFDSFEGAIVYILADALRRTKQYKIDLKWHFGGFGQWRAELGRKNNYYIYPRKINNGYNHFGVETLNWASQQKREVLMEIKEEKSRQLKEWKTL